MLSHFLYLFLRPLALIDPRGLAIIKTANMAIVVEKIGTKAKIIGIIKGIGTIRATMGITSGETEIIGMETMWYAISIIGSEA